MKRKRLGFPLNLSQLPCEGQGRKGRRRGRRCPGRRERGSPRPGPALLPGRRLQVGEKDEWLFEVSRVTS